MSPSELTTHAERFGATYHERRDGETIEFTARQFVNFCTWLASAPAGQAEVSDEQIRSLWQTTDTGDIEDDILAFARAVLALASSAQAGEPLTDEQIAEVLRDEMTLYDEGATVTDKATLIRAVRAVLARGKP